MDIFLLLEMDQKVMEYVKKVGDVARDKSPKHLLEYLEALMKAKEYHLQFSKQITETLDTIISRTEKSLKYE